MSDNENGEPTWLDTTYLTKILKKYTQNQLGKIISFTKIPATKKGENYASCMYLITALYTTEPELAVIKEVQFIVKSRLESEVFAQIEEDFNVFVREAQVYNVIMDLAEELLRSVKDETCFGPRAIYLDERIIVLENLKLQGFSIENVKTGLDFECVRLILEKLAKFHAVTMVLYKKNPDIFRHHLPSNISEHPSPLHDVYTNTIQNCIEYCQTNPKLQRYVPKLQAFGEKIIPKMINVFSRSQTDRYHVLNHGDVWVNNMMFRKDLSGNVVDVLFVDYQEGFYGSPGIDWNFFIFTSWQKEVFQNHFEELLTIYHRVLSALLHKLQHDERIPTIEDVRKAIISKGYHGLTSATCLLPILINEHAELSDPINFILNTDEALANRRKIFDNPKYGERLEVFLEFFETNGIL